jgi:hypothetical protein
MLLVNLVASVLFGLFISVRVLCCSEESSWLMPLLIAPIEYWAKFGIAIAGSVFALAFWKELGF